MSESAIANSTSSQASEGLQQCRKVNGKQIDYDSFINTFTKRRTESLLRKLIQTMVAMPPETISLAGGIPNTIPFPFHEIQVELKDGVKLKINGKTLDSALQYLPTMGYAPLLSFLRDAQDREHGPLNWEERSLIITVGGLEGIAVAFDMCITEGDSIIIQHPLYLAIPDMLKPYKPQYLVLEQDEYGVQPEILRSELERYTREGQPLPKLMYVNPTGGNPSGTCLSNERRREIYALACQYNFVIFEDDPYYHVHFLEEYPESFLSLDTEGRVLRFDSFSKTMSSGMRVGFVTGPKQLVRRIEIRLQNSTIHTSAISQVIIYTILEEWGYERLTQHYKKTQAFYKERRDLCVAACETHLKGLAEWTIPKAGMFMWLRLNLRDTMRLAMKRCIENLVLVVPGHTFTVNDRRQPCPFIRISYSIATPEQIDKGCELLAKIIREEQESNPNDQNIFTIK